MQAMSDDLSDTSKPLRNEPGEAVADLLAEGAGGSGGEDDPLTRLKKRAVGPIQRRFYGPLNRIIDHLGYPACVALFVFIIGGSWLIAKLWSDPESVSRAYTVSRYYLDARELAPPQDADTSDVVRELTNQLKDDISPANRNSANGSYSSWTQAQMVVSLHGQDIVDPQEMGRWFQAQTGECSCWREFVADPAHTGATSWVFLAYSRMKARPTEQEIEVVLKNQHKPGWWPMFPATDNPWNASTYATSMSIWSLQELLNAGLIGEAQKPAVTAAISKGRSWLLDNTIAGQPARWKDYPSGIYGQESIAISGLALHALHRTPGAQPVETDVAWMAKLPKELPKPKEQTSSAQTVITEQNGPVGDPTHHFFLPWVLIATADAYAKGTLAQRAQAARLFHQIPDRREAITRELKDMPWAAAETLIALRYLRGDDII